MFGAKLGKEVSAMDSRFPNGSQCQLIHAVPHGLDYFKRGERVTVIGQKENIGRIIVRVMVEDGRHVVMFPDDLEPVSSEERATK